jgi:DNA-binding IclR family transcriptional regulator
VIGPAFRLREQHFKEIGRRCVDAAAEIARRIDA